jgi:hypothetical protein
LDVPSRVRQQAGHARCWRLSDEELEIGEEAFRLFRPGCDDEQRSVDLIRHRRQDEREPAVADPGDGDLRMAAEGVQEALELG